MSVPLTTTSGAWSPPMPSSARTTLPAFIEELVPLAASSIAGAAERLLLGRGAVRKHRHVLAIVAAMRADHVRPLQLAAVLAFDMGHRRNGVVGPPHVAARLRNLLLGYSHDDLQNGAATPVPKIARPRLVGAAGRLL